MTSPSDLFRRMRETLAGAFSSRSQAELLALDSGLDRTQLELAGTPAVFWEEIIELAERSGRLDALLEQATRRAPAVQPLFDERAEYAQWVAGGRPREPGPSRAPQLGTREDPELATLRRQLKSSRENLLLVQERKDEYVDSTTVPLQLVKEERRLQDRIAELEEQIVRLGG